MSRETTYLLLKRVFDVLTCVVGGVLCIPLLTVISMSIVLDSGFPVLHRQQRVGRKGVLFTMYKFRSMQHNAEARLRDDPVLYRLYVSNGFKLPPDRDPRITRIGRILRRTSLDELPQILNVLRGDMSLVGPRPLVPEEIDKHYRDTRDRLLSVLPGMTGLWQVYGRSTVDYPERADIELSYVTKRSLYLDLWILSRTIKAVAGQKGAH